MLLVVRCCRSGAGWVEIIFLSKIFLDETGRNWTKRRLSILSTSASTFISFGFPVLRTRHAGFAGMAIPSIFLLNFRLFHGCNCCCWKGRAGSGVLTLFQHKPVTRRVVDYVQSDRILKTCIFHEPSSSVSEKRSWFIPSCMPRDS